MIHVLKRPKHTRLEDRVYANKIQVTLDRYSKVHQDNLLHN